MSSWESLDEPIHLDGLEEELNGILQRFFFLETILMEPSPQLLIRDRDHDIG
jgi:hypothetical protein